MTANILVVEGNERAATDRMIQLGARPYAESYAELLESLHGGLRCTIVHPSEDGADCLPPDKALPDFDGVVWTGSALNIYDESTPVSNQLKLAERIFSSSLPVFGSCWGSQIAVVALGGKVRLNPKGREIGIGRDMRLTDAGREHPMYAGKPHLFDVLSAHMDETEELPPGAMVLAANSMSDVQALAIETDEVSFWGTQYHPEFDFTTMAVVMKRQIARLVEEGIAASEEDLAATIRDYEAMDNRNDSDAVAQRHHLDQTVVDPNIRHREIANWLQHRVISN